MGIHTYPCPTCYSTQRVKADAGQLVEIQDCPPCAQTKAHLAEGGLEAQLNAELDEYARRARKR
jgi:glutaredoxin